MDSGRKWRTTPSFTSGPPQRYRNRVQRSTNLQTLMIACAKRRQSPTGQVEPQRAAKEDVVESATPTAAPRERKESGMNDNDYDVYDSNLVNRYHARPVNIPCLPDGFRDTTSEDSATEKASVESQKVQSGISKTRHSMSRTSEQGQLPGKARK